MKPKRPTKKFAQDPGAWATYYRQMFEYAAKKHAEQFQKRWSRGERDD